MNSPQNIRNNAPTFLVSLFLLLPAAACDDVVGFDLDAEGSDSGNSSDVDDMTDGDGGSDDVDADSADTDSTDADADAIAADGSETGDADGRDTMDADAIAADSDIDADDVGDVNVDVLDTDIAEEGNGPEPVFLGSAGDYVILSKSGIDTIPSSIITGNIGVSPIDATAITGFSETIDSTGRFSTSDQVTGQIHAANYGVPTPSLLTAAISAVETAYTDAAGRSLPTTTELGGGEIGGLTIEPGLHKWSSAVTISTSVTLNGGPNDVWIFQIAGGITQASDTQVLLTGGASPDNIFWQSFGDVVLDTDAHIEGIVLSQTTIILRTGASARGRLLAQTAITLDQATVTEPN